MRITYPNYSTVTLDLSEAGRYELAQAGQRLQIVHATSGADVAPQARIWVSLGQQSEDGIPLSMGGIIAGRVERYFIRWDAQPGCKVWVLVSQSGEAEGGILVQTPPTASLTVQDGTAWQVTDPGTAAAVAGLVAAQRDQRGASYFSGTPSSVVTLITPASNTGGAVLRTAAIRYGWISISAEAPASFYTGLPVLGGMYDTHTSYVGALYVPAGHGAYLCNAGGYYAHATWDML